MSNQVIKQSVPFEENKPEFLSVGCDSKGGILPSAGRVKIGLVGLNFGRHILKGLLEKPIGNFFELTALCDVDEKRLADAAKKAPVACYNNLDELLADPNMEVVGLFTKPAGRASFIRKIIRSGRHVITTKPLESDPEEAKAVLEEARALGVRVECNSPSLTPSPDIKLVKEWEQKYQLGRPVAARANVWASYREEADGSWYDDEKSCPAAPLYRLGIYLINDLTRLWGRVEHVQVMQTRLFTKRPTADNAQMGLFFENQALANVFASFCVNDGDQYGNSLILNYENGTIYRNAGPAWTVPGGRRSVALVQSHENQCKVVDQAFINSQSGDYHWEDFARAVRGEPQPAELTPDQMVEGIRVIKSLLKAQSDGGVARVVH